MKKVKSELSEGQQFGRLTVLRETSRLPIRTYLCRCSCGKEKTISVSNLVWGKTKSCGCLKAELTAARSTTHGCGNRKNDLYRLWGEIKTRCYNKNCKAYGWYGGRGIRMYREWKDDFHKFKEYVETTIGQKPGPAYSLDRVNNALGYVPDNLRWASAKEQNNNRRGNVLVSCFGKAQTVPEWSRETGINRGTLYERLFILKWSAEKALTHPIRSRKQSHV